MKCCYMLNCSSAPFITPNIYYQSPIPVLLLLFSRTPHAKKKYRFCCLESNVASSVMFLNFSHNLSIPLLGKTQFPASCELESCEMQHHIIAH